MEDGCTASQLCLGWDEYLASCEGETMAVELEFVDSEFAHGGGRRGQQRERREGRRTIDR
jgi:hypothetical protein